MRKRRLKKSVKIALGAIITCIVVTATTFTILAINQSNVKVINFVGETKNDVEQWLSDNEIDTSMIRYEEAYSETYDADIIMEQSLKEGETFNKDTKLNFTVSLGADPTVEFTLPDFTGKKEDEIKEWFDENKFTNYVITKEINESVEVGTFISCDHETNSTVKRSDVITVKVSSIKEEIIVPDLSSYSKSNIEAWAEANQIIIDYIEENSNDVEAGKIISISVIAGDRIYQGDTIQISISKGQATQEIATTQETTKASDDNQNYATSETKNSSVSSNTTGTSSQGSKSETTDSNLPIETGTCYAQDTSLYDGKSASEISSAFSSGGCKVSISYAADASSNPYSYNGGIKSAYIDGSTYYVTVYQSWAN